MVGGGTERFGSLSALQLVGTHGQREPLSVNSGDIGTGGSLPPGGAAEDEGMGAPPPDTQIQPEEVG